MFSLPGWLEHLVTHVISLLYRGQSGRLMYSGHRAKQQLTASSSYWTHTDTESNINLHVKCQRWTHFHTSHVLAAGNGVDLL